MLAIKPDISKPILEIGPGPGALTQHLLDAGCHVIVIEKDARFIPILKNMATNSKGTLTIHHADVLKVNFTKILPKGCQVVGNLPYNIGTQITINLLETPTYFKSFIFMLQKEVVQRMTAKPKEKNWGRLSVLCDLLCARHKLFDVPPKAFTPPPKVTSSIVQLTPYAAPRYEVNRKQLARVLSLGFNQRRKMLRTSLKNILTEVEIESLGITPTNRPETLTTEQFCMLANAL